MITDDGGVIGSGVPVGQYTGPRDHYTKYGLYQGQIIRRICAEEPESVFKEGQEYVVRINGQDFYGVRDLRRGGGVFNYHERIFTPSDKTYGAKSNHAEYVNNLSGEIVWVLFANGNADKPLIIGSTQHPRNPIVHKACKADGIFEIYEFNGIEFKIDKDSNYTITQLGRKDIQSEPGKPIILNPEATGSFTKFHGNGDFEINVDGEELRAKFIKAEHKFELYAQDNKMIFDLDGILIEDKFSNEIRMTELGIKVEDFNNNIMTMNDLGINMTDIQSNFMVMNPDGVAISTPGGTKVNLLEADDLINIETAAGVKVDIDGPNSLITLTVQSSIVEIDGATGKISLKASLVDIGTAAAFPVALGTNLLAWLNSHTHIAPQAPAGSLPTTPPIIPAPLSTLSLTVSTQA